MTSFATELATPSVTDERTYGYLTAFNIFTRLELKVTLKFELPTVRIMSLIYTVILKMELRPKA